MFQILLAGGFALWVVLWVAYGYGYLRVALFYNSHRAGQGAARTGVVLGIRVGIACVVTAHVARGAFIDGIWGAVRLFAAVPQLAPEDKSVFLSAGITEWLNTQAYALLVAQPLPLVLSLVIRMVAKRRASIASESSEPEIHD